MEKQFVKTAFSLIELSVVSIIISILIAGVVSGRKMSENARLSSAQSITKNSSIGTIPDLALWLETSLDGSVTTSQTFSDGFAISSWNDISGNKNHIIQAVLANQPSYLKSGINGLPSIKFDGVNDILVNDIANSKKAPITIGNSKYSVLIVWRLNSIANNSTLLHQSDTSYSKGRVFGAWVKDNVFYVSGGSNYKSPTLSALSIGGKYSFLLSVNNTEANNISLYSNLATKSVASVGSCDGDGNCNQSNPANLNSDDDPNDLDGSGDFLDTTSFNSLGNNVFAVGGKMKDDTASKFIDASVSEVMVFNRNLTPTEILLIKDYLSKKYNLIINTTII